MIELQERHSPIDRCRPLIIINMFEDSEATLWIINNFGKDRYLRICEQINESLNTKHTLNWLIADTYHSDYELVETWNDVIERCCNYSMFDENDKSTFPYWFAHWCSFQLCALNLGIWKLKYLFHDFEKPWLKLIWQYKKVQKWHREHNKHHLEYGLKHGWDNVDWEALVIDWECSHMSKKQCPLNAREEMERIFKTDKWKPYENTIRPYLELILNTYFL